MDKCNQDITNHKRMIQHFDGERSKKLIDDLHKEKCKGKFDIRKNQ